MKKILLSALFLAMCSVSYGQTLLNENFQTGTLPATWTVQQTNAAETWHVEDLGTSDFRATVNYDEALGSQDEKLITPSLDLSGTTAFSLKAKIGLSYYWAVNPNNNYDAFIKVSTDNGVTWTQVWSENNLGVFTNWIMNPVTVSLSAYTGNANVKIAFQYVGSDGAALYLDDVIVEAAPTVAPNCAALTAPANAATGITFPSAMLTWTAPTTGGPVDSYEVYLDQNTNPTTLLASTNALTYEATALAPSTTYYWKVVPKNAVGSATGCAVYSFTTAANPFAPYCGPVVFDNVEPITLVNFAGINNVTPANTAGAAAHENFLSKIGTVKQGMTYPITLQGNTDGPFTNRFVVFIDWDQNGTLDDAGEVYQITQLLVNSTGVDGQQVVQNIVVPAGASLGNTRMRVKKIFGTTDYVDPCKGGFFGQIEEYTLDVGTLAVADANKSQVKVFPNPVVDVLNIEGASKVSSVQVFDLSGKIVSSHALNAVKNQVNLSKLAPGVYVVNIQTEEGIQSVKVVKK